MGFNFSTFRHSRWPRCRQALHPPVKALSCCPIHPPGTLLPRAHIAPAPPPPPHASSSVPRAGVFLLPHMISLDQEGNVWVTDTGRHQAFKFTQDGTLLLTVGVEGEPGGDHGHLCKPTQVCGCAWGPQCVRMHRGGVYTSTPKQLNLFQARLNPHPVRPIPLTDPLLNPLQVEVLKDGSFLVGDGYCNSRVMRYNPDGSYKVCFRVPMVSLFTPMA